MSETNNFEALLAEIDTLAKAKPTGDDGKIAAAAGVDPAAAGAAGDGETEEDPPEGAPVIAKSFKLRLDDGTEVDAMDGAELVKALTSRVEGLEGGLTKALTGIASLLKSQGEQIAKLSAAPQPRKTVLAITEKPAAALAKSEPAGMSGEEFMTKAMSAFAAGKITGRDIAIAEQSLNAGVQPPADLVRAVIA